MSHLGHTRKKNFGRRFQRCRCGIFGSNGREISFTGSARAILGSKTLSAEERISLTSWLVAQRKAGIGVPTITPTNLDAALSRSRLPFSERVDAALQYLAKIRPRMDQEFVFVAAAPDDEGQALMAATETESPAELIRLFGILSGMELLDAKFAGSGAAVRVLIKAGGWQRLDKLRAQSRATPQAFVAMWFHPTTLEPYEKGIAPAIEGSGYIPIRIDKKEHINKIDDEIIAEIRRHFSVRAGGVFRAPINMF